jgi:hypothetical protein
MPSHIVRRLNPFVPLKPSEIDAKRFAGAVRDTVLVPPGRRVVVAFDANNPGFWALPERFGQLLVAHAEHHAPLAKAAADVPVFSFCTSQKILRVSPSSLLARSRHRKALCLRRLGGE